MRKILTIVVCMFLLCGCSSSPLKKQTFTIELGNDVFANPILYVKDNVDVEGMSVKTLNVGIRKEDNQFVSGSNDYILVGTYDFAIVTKTGREIPFKIKIKDTKPPTLRSYKKEITVKKGSIINWDDYIGADDLSGISYEMIPNIDTTIVGSYPIDLKVSDRFGNSVTKTIVVNVE
ncbi:MAG: hypothetical protein Q4C49_10455 [Bacillota bacterium]|nr:hypothetical protein [Bacillota bacterium]